MVNSTCKRIIAFWLIKTVNTSNNKTARISCSFSSPSITPDHDRIDCVHRITTGNRLSLRDTQQPSSIVRIPFDFHACAKRGIPYRAKRHRSFGRKRRKKEKSYFIIDTRPKISRRKRSSNEIVVEIELSRTLTFVNPQRVSNRVSRDYVHELASNFSEVIDVRACPSSREIYRELNEP